jgi:hypothetical protein
MSMRRALARTLTLAFGTASLVLGAVAFAQTPTGNAIARGLTRMAHGGCPFGYDQAMSPDQRERARAQFAAIHRGETRAPSRPALGFTLDQTTREQVQASMSAQGVQCSPGHGISDLTCLHVPSSALPGTAPAAPERTLWFTFGTKDQLLSVVAVSRDPNAQTISNTFANTQNVLSSQAGAATTTAGSADSHALTQGLLRQASAEYRFKNYYAVERAANMGNAYVLTEEYRSLPD